MFVYGLYIRIMYLLCADDVVMMRGQLLAVQVMPPTIFGHRRPLSHLHPTSSVLEHHLELVKNRVPDK